MSDEGRDGHRVRDEGAALPMVIMLVVLCSFMIIPMLGYTGAVTTQRSLAASQVRASESVKGALRVALANPLGLFQACGAASTTVSVTLPDPKLSEPVVNTCFMVGAEAGVPMNTLRWGLTTTMAGQVPPPAGEWVTGLPYPDSGSPQTAAWLAQTTAVTTAQKIFAPLIPNAMVSPRSPTGYAMPSPYPACTVYFPGRYPDGLTISAAKRVYFASGVYIFDKPVVITGNADVVVGGGSTKGCVESDQVAAFYATNAPDVHGISGLGATFVFGAAGKLVVDTSVPGTRTSIVFNKRYVSTKNQALDTSDGVSIMTVNGATTGGVLTDLSMPGVLEVPLSQMATGGPITAATGYVPSTVLASDGQAVVDIQLLDARAVTVKIPGYVSAPQGGVSIRTDPAADPANKSVKVSGGVLAGRIDVAGLPATMELGLTSPVVLRTFKIDSRNTRTGAQGTAIVQVKESGVYKVNSWWLVN